MGDKSKIAERIIPVGVWKVPQNPFVKINFDSGFCKEDNRSCFGIIIRNDIGNILCSKTVLHANIPSPFCSRGDSLLLKGFDRSSNGFSKCRSRRRLLVRDS
ncbi:hypothetical protein Goari_014448 [Gossypium aridum]|uniref:RNase H type-1 domain-containing protein n=1 Tax=Gossypium aridum TaxID=34290 RepID=A0A7J8XHY4_GOSAI|nr:hypothetical protein [Gossypium aridum]